VSAQLKMTIFEDPGQDEFDGLNLRQLKIDEAYLVVTSSLDHSTFLYGRTDECDQCSFQFIGEVNGHSNDSYVLNTKFDWMLHLQQLNETQTVTDNDDQQNSCQFHAPMGEFGVYDMSVSPVLSGYNCMFSTAKEPVNIYTPILACFLFYTIIAIVWIIGSRLYKKGKFNCFKKAKCEEGSSESGVATAVNIKDNITAPNKEKKTRLKSLDTFRGISIVVMIFVNGGGGQYSFFEHAPWNGLTVADLVFPWFLWIMGVCVPIALSSAFRRKESKQTIFLHLLRRSCLLFLFGLMNNTLWGVTDLNFLRIPGVLQRFAVSYFFVGTLGLLCSPGRLTAPEESSKWRVMFQDVIVLIPQWIAVLVLVAAHCFITFFLPVNNCPTGYLGPGGRHLDAQFGSECIGGAAGLIDRWILSTNHIYNYPTAREIYSAGPYDPEGILGSLTTIFQVFLGVQAGTTLLLFKDWQSRVKRWLSWSFLTGSIGALLCLASKNQGWIPLNKNLWSVSFVMVTSCFAFFLLSFCYYLIDVKKWWNGAPFFYPGMNAILMYMGHEWANVFPWHWQIGAMNTHFMVLAEALWNASLWVIISTWLFHKKIFIAL